MKDVALHVVIQFGLMARPVREAFTDGFGFGVAAPHVSQANDHIFGLSTHA